MANVEGPLAKELREIAEGKKSIPTTYAIRHHFVPAFALSKFATPQKRDGLLYQLSAKTGQPKKITPEEACFVEELYTQDADDGSPDRVLESFFSIVESHAANAFARFLADPLKLSDEDRQTIAYYLAFQYQRTPVALEHSAQTQEAMMAVMMGLQFANAEYFKTQHHEVFGEGASDEEIEDLRRTTIEMLKSGGIGFEKPEAGAFYMMMAVADEVASSIAALTWGLVEATDGEFVTSDRALAMHDPTLTFPWSGHALRSSDNAQTTVPLSPTHCLVLCQSDQPVVVLQADADDVREINLGTYGWAYQFIYGRTQEVVQRVRIQAREKPALVIRPRVPTQIIIEEAVPNDPNVGKEHVKRGWPRGFMMPGEDGRKRFHSYQLVDPKDRESVRAAISAEEATLRAVAVERGKRVIEPVDPRIVDPA